MKILANIVIGLGTLLDNFLSHMFTWLIAAMCVGASMGWDWVPEITQGSWFWEPNTQLLQVLLVLAYLGSGVLIVTQLLEGAEKEFTDYNMAEEPFFTFHVIGALVWYSFVGFLAPGVALGVAVLGPLFGFDYHRQYGPIRKGTTRNTISSKAAARGFPPPTPSKGPHRK